MLAVSLKMRKKGRSKNIKVDLGPKDLWCPITKYFSCNE